MHFTRTSLLGCSLLAAAALLAGPTFAADTPARSAKAATKKAAPAKPKAAGKSAATRAAAKDVAKKDVAKKDVSRKGGGKKATAKKAAEDNTPGPLADFGKVDAPADVVHVANWASYTRNPKKRAFVLIDKKMATLYVFAPDGKLKSHTPILLGKAVGDHTVPGIGTKPMAQIQEHEKTTPAGAFLARPGKNTSGEDIIWIDYDAAVSMHRLRKVAAEERRAERMATPDASDNRISYGCVNVPARFYDRILKPTVLKQGVVVYVLPETKTPQQQFGSFDVPPVKAAQAQAAKPAT